MHTAGTHTIEIGYESRKLGDFSTEIYSANRLGFTPGLRPIILECPRNDRAELHHWAKVLAVKCGLDRSQRLLTAASFEQILKHRGDPGFCVLITDGEQISPDLQERILMHRTDRLPRPPIFIVVTEVDPGDLKRSGAWSDVFRGYFARHWPWPGINERRRDWPQIFRATIKAIEKADGLESQATRITTATMEKLKGLSVSPSDGSAAIIKMAMNAYGVMTERGDPCILPDHLPDLYRPSSRPTHNYLEASQAS